MLMSPVQPSRFRYWGYASSIQNLKTFEKSVTSEILCHDMEKLQDPDAFSESARLVKEGKPSKKLLCFFCKSTWIVHKMWKFSAAYKHICHLQEFAAKVIFVSSKANLWNFARCGYMSSWIPQFCLWCPCGIFWKLMNVDAMLCARRKMMQCLWKHTPLPPLLLLWISRRTCTKLSFLSNGGNVNGSKGFWNAGCCFTEKERCCI